MTHTSTPDFLAYIPSPAQGVWWLGPVPLRAYALCILCGIIVALFWTRARYAARGGNPEDVLDVAFFAVPGGIIGGRVYHLITDWKLYWGPGGDPSGWWKITNGGLGIWGAVIGGALAAWVVLSVKKLPVAPFAGAIAPTIVLAQGIGRLGNYFNQELFGRPTTVPWGLEIYQRVTDSGVVDQIAGHSNGVVIGVVHPTFLYELVWDVLVAVVLVWIDRRWRPSGEIVFGLYVAGYTAGRFVVELMRSDAATHIFGLRVNTIMSAVCCLAACGFVVWRVRRAGSGKQDTALAEL